MCPERRSREGRRVAEAEGELAPWRWYTHVFHLEGFLLQFLHCQNVLNGNAVERLVSCGREGLVSRRAQRSMPGREEVFWSPLLR